MTRRQLSLIDLLTGRNRICRLPVSAVGPRSLKHDARPPPRDDTFIPRAAGAGRAPDRADRDRPARLEPHGGVEIRVRGRRHHVRIFGRDLVDLRFQGKAHGRVRLS